MYKTVKAVALLTGTALLVAAKICISTAAASIDVVTYHNDTARTGQNLSETFLNAATVSVSTFGKTGFFLVDGKVDAQPLYLSGVTIAGQGSHNVLYVGTEHDSVYAFYSDTGAQLWHVSIMGSGKSTR